MVPRVEIELEGKKYGLALDLNAMYHYEKHTGKNSFQFGAEMNAQEMRAFLWAAMLREQPDIKMEDVGALVHAGNLAEISEKLVGLFGESLPEPEEVEDTGEGKNQ